MSGLGEGDGGKGGRDYMASRISHHVTEEAPLSGALLGQRTSSSRNLSFVIVLSRWYLARTVLPVVLSRRGGGCGRRA